MDGTWIGIAGTDGTGSQNRTNQMLSHRVIDTSVDTTVGIAGIVITHDSYAGKGGETSPTKPQRTSVLVMTMTFAVFIQ